MSRTLKIGSPVVTQHGNVSRLSARITTDDGLQQELYFQVCSEYTKYLVYERCDSFVLMLMTYCMYHGFDILCDAPMTGRLKYQLSEYLIPLMAQNIKEYNLIHLSIPVADEVKPAEQGVCTGFSAGVDSFYTLLSHRKEDDSGKRAINSLLFNNVGALTYDPDEASRIFSEKSDRFSKIAAEIGLPLISIDTNILSLLESLGEDCPCIYAPDVFKNIACAFAMKRMFSIYYQSSGSIPIEFRFDDPAGYEPIIAWCLTTGYFSLYLPGQCQSRIEKVEFISDDPLVQRHLNVCAGDNDSTCIKCTRTMFELYALGKLDGFKGVFKTEWFKGHLADRVGRLFADNTEWRDGFNRESLDAARRNGVSVPFTAHLYAWLKWRPINLAYRLLRSNKKLKAWYHNSGLKGVLKV